MNKLILTGVLLMNAMVLHAGDDDPAMMEKILTAIGFVESGGKDIGLHPDGVSYGRYGVTMIAVHELQRLDILDCHFHEAWLNLPKTNKNVAQLYLQEMYRRHKSWYLAVGYYHGGNEKARDDYAKKVFEIFTDGVSRASQREQKTDTTDTTLRKTQE